MGIKDETMGRKINDEILALNAKEIIFNPHLLLIIRRKCHHFARTP
jgi:hypothetical protein